MGYRKINNIFFVFVLFVSFHLNSQVIRPFAGLSMNINTAYETNGFYTIIGGFDLKATNYLRPEFKIGCAIGNIESKINSSSGAEKVFERNTTAIYLGIVPKIIIKSNNENYYYQILPQYNFGKLEAAGKYLEIDANSNVVFSKKETISKYKNFVGFGFGVHVFLSDKHKDAFDFNLYFQRIDFGELISKLEYSKQSITTKNSIGFGVNYFFK